MSRRWTRDELEALVARAHIKLRGENDERRFGSVGALDLHGIPAQGRERATAAAKTFARAAAKQSPLVLELIGHLRLLGVELVEEHRFHPQRKWRFDLADVEKKIGVEIDGSIFNAENGREAGKHSRGAGQCRDMEKRNAAVVLGWRVLVYGPPHVRSGDAARQIAELVAQPCAPVCSADKST